MTAEELAELNAELAPLNQVVREQERDGQPVYQLCSLTPVQEIEDPVAFALIYGVEVA